MALEQTCEDKPEAQKVPEWKLRNEKFRDLLLRITPEENIEYIDVNKSHLPYHYHIDGAKVSFLTHWANFYEVDGTNLKLPEDEQQLRADIKFVKERVYGRSD